MKIAILPCYVIFNISLSKAAVIGGLGLSTFVAYGSVVDGPQDSRCNNPVSLKGATRPSHLLVSASKISVVQCPSSLGLANWPCVATPASPPLNCLGRVGHAPALRTRCNQPLAHFHPILALLLLLVPTIALSSFRTHPPPLASSPERTRRC